MSKEFNPDEFLEKTAIVAQDQQEIEKRNQQQAPQVQSAVPGQGPIAPSMMDQATDFVTQTALPVTYGVGKAAADVAASHPWLTAGAAAMLPNNILNKIPGGQKVAAVKDIASNLGRAAEAYAAKEARIGSGGAYGRTPVGTPTNPIGTPTPTPQPVTQQPSIIQRGMDTASRMRQLAANRVAGFGASGAAVPAGVALGGLAATGIAGGQMAAMTPEQRRALYENEMLGAMGGDAGLAAAIMNRGQ